MGQRPSATTWASSDAGGAEAQRIPYLHYYYTWQWFREHGLESIGHISANHSTWDLECENLPMESLR